MMYLRLASASPRRSDLLRQMGLCFELTSPVVDECVDTIGDLERIARLNAEKKALWVSERYPDDLCLGADTVVGLGNQLFHKPIDLQDAHAMLKALSGKEHRVITGLALICQKRAIFEVHAVSTRVRIKPLSDTEIQNYFQVVNPLDKSGAYAIQQGIIIEGYDGSLSNVVGLPIECLEERLRALHLWDDCVVNK